MSTPEQDGRQLSFEYIRLLCLLLSVVSASLAAPPCRCGSLDLGDFDWSRARQSNEEEGSFTFDWSDVFQGRGKVTPLPNLDHLFPPIPSSQSRDNDPLLLEFDLLHPSRLSSEGRDTDTLLPEFDLLHSLIPSSQSRDTNTPLPVFDLLHPSQLSSQGHGKVIPLSGLDQLFPPMRSQQGHRNVTLLPEFDFLHPSRISSQGRDNVTPLLSAALLHTSFDVRDTSQSTETHERNSHPQSFHLGFSRSPTDEPKVGLGQRPSAKLYWNERGVQLNQTETDAVRRQQNTESPLTFLLTAAGQRHRYLNSSTDDRQPKRTHGDVRDLPFEISGHTFGHSERTQKSHNIPKSTTNTFPFIEFDNDGNILNHGRREDFTSSPGLSLSETEFSRANSRQSLTSTGGSQPQLRPPWKEEKDHHTRIRDPPQWSRLLTLQLPEEEEAEEPERESKTAVHPRGKHRHWSLEEDGDLEVAPLKGDEGPRRKTKTVVHPRDEHRHWSLEEEEDDLEMAPSKGDEGPRQKTKTVIHLRGRHRHWSKEEDDDLEVAPLKGDEGPRRRTKTVVHPRGKHRHWSKEEENDFKVATSTGDEGPRQKTKTVVHPRDEHRHWSKKEDDDLEVAPPDDYEAASSSLQETGELLPSESSEMPQNDMFGTLPCREGYERDHRSICRQVVKVEGNNFQLNVVTRKTPRLRHRQVTKSRRA